MQNQYILLLLCLCFTRAKNCGWHTQLRYFVFLIWRATPPLTATACRHIDNNYSKLTTFLHLLQAPNVQKVDSAIHWINLYRMKNAIGFPNTYPLQQPEPVLYNNLKATNRLFPSFPGPLFQNEGRCWAFDMEIIFHSHTNKTHFHKKG